MTVDQVAAKVQQQVDDIIDTKLDELLVSLGSQGYDPEALIQMLTEESRRLYAHNRAVIMPQVRRALEAHLEGCA